MTTMGPQLRSAASAADLAGPRWITAAELAAGAADAPLLDADAKVHQPLVLVDLDATDGTAPDEVVNRAVDRARACGRLLVGVALRTPSEALLSEQRAQLVHALDLTLVAGHTPPQRPIVGVPDAAADAAALHAAASANPQAAIVLGGLLRATEMLALTAALDAESFAYSTLLGGSEFRRWLDARGPLAAPPAVPEPVLVERVEDSLRLTLNRPQRRNAYGRQLRDALVEALRLAIVDDSVRTVVLCGAGPSFCSGGDLAEFGTTPDLTTAHLIRTRAGAARFLHELADRLEVRVHGSCVGAGIEMAAFAGRVTADPATVFRLPELQMGLVPGAGGTVSIPRRIGRWRTLYLALTGRAIDAPTGLSWGLVDRVDGVDQSGQPANP